MQDLVTDKLASKGIPAAITLSSLPHLIGEYAKAVRTNRNRTAPTVGNKAATPKAASAHATPFGGIESERTYTGSMAITGTLSADNGQNGNWTGSLKETLHLTVDALGNGTGYEHFDGYITLHVGDRSSGAPLTFDTPVFTLQHGKFDYPSGFFSYESLSFDLDVKGSFSGSQQTISEHLSLPFTGSVNGVGVSGLLHGSSSVRTPPLSIGGSSSDQSTYATSKVRPFGNTTISDLSGTKVTATVKLSKAAGGTLTNLSGGTYNKATGVYTITGTSAVVNRAVKGLSFVSVGDLSSLGRSTRIGFTLRVTDGVGAGRTVRTDVALNYPLFIGGISTHQATRGTTPIDPFQNVGISEVRGQRLETVEIKLSNPANGVLENLSDGTYNKKTGIYLFHGTAGAATKALHKLEFVPAKSGVVTTFTLTAENTDGAVRTATTTVAARGAAVSAHAKTDVALFSQYVALGLHGAHDQASVLSSRHDLPAHPLSELAGSHR
jgi:hypothetical protein